MSLRSTVVAVLVFLLAFGGIDSSIVAAEECTSAIACFRFEMGLMTEWRGTIFRDAKLGVPSGRNFTRDHGVNLTYIQDQTGLFASIEELDADYHVNAQTYPINRGNCVFRIGAQNVAFVELMEQYNGQACDFSLARTESSSPSSAKTFVYKLSTSKGSKDTDCGSPVDKCPNQPPQPGAAEKQEEAFIAVGAG